VGWIDFKVLKKVLGGMRDLKGIEKNGVKLVDFIYMKVRLNVD